jgi:hypothetical protein
MKPATKPARVDPVIAFQARAEARALLYCAGEMTLHEAVDGLQREAQENGPVDAIGQDAVQKILAEAFAPHRDDPWDAPGWRQAAIEYHKQRQGRTLIVEIKPERLKQARQSTFDALLWELREYGVARLARPQCQRRLAELSTDQMRALIAALMRLRSRYPIILLKLGDAL